MYCTRSVDGSHVERDFMEFVEGMVPVLVTCILRANWRLTGLGNYMEAYPELPKPLIEEHTLKSDTRTGYWTL